MIMDCVVILSGGMDSTTALAQEVKFWGKKRVSTLTFSYGSKHNHKENGAALNIARFYGVENHRIDLPWMNDLFRSNLLQSGEEIPEGHYAESSMKKTVVPFRNGIMLSIAAGFAESVEAVRLIIGSHAGDHAIYPDCRDSFMKPFADAIYQGTWTKLCLERPFERLSKADIVKLGVELKVPYELTYSCYKGGEVHCGRCGTCVERLEAFAQEGAVDPVSYEDREYWKSVVKQSITT